MTGPVVRTARVLDELVRDDGAVVLVARDKGHRVVRVSVLGQAIRELASGGVTLTVLESSLVERLGAPQDMDVSSLVEAAVQALAAEGLVSVSADAGGREPAVDLHN